MPVALVVAEPPIAAAAAAGSAGSEHSPDSAQSYRSVGLHTVLAGPLPMPVAAAVVAAAAVAARLYHMPLPRRCWRTFRLSKEAQDALSSFTQGIEYSFTIAWPRKSLCLMGSCRIKIELGDQVCFCKIRDYSKTRLVFIEH